MIAYKATTMNTDLLATARDLLESREAYVSLEDDREIITGLACGPCEKRRTVLALAGTLAEKDALCATCGEPMRPELRSRLDGNEGLNALTLAEIGLPPLHIVRARDDASGRSILLELTGDLPELFDRPAAGRNQSTS